MPHVRLLPPCRCIMPLLVLVVLAVAVVGCRRNWQQTGQKIDPKAAEPKLEGKLRVDISASAGVGGSKPDDASALPKIVVRDKREWTLQETAGRSLGQIGAAAVPDLTKLLGDKDPQLRKRAAEVLARIGPAAESAVPDLILALDDEDDTVRKSAALALGQIGPAAAPAVPKLMRVLNEPESPPPEDE